MSKIRDKWEFYGESDPYFAVVTIDKFKKENLDENTKAEFFKSGEDYFVKVWEIIERHFVKQFKPKKALDFGCGVGRLVIPLASRSEHVVGIDISEKMLEEARQNCTQQGITNTNFFQTNEFFSSENSGFDLIHSFIVLQHINPKIGENIVENLINKLKVGGVGVLHFTFYNPGGRFNWLKFRIYRDFPLINWFKNFVKREKQEPFIPMYLYDLNKILAILQKNNCHNCLIKFSDHGFYGAVIFFQKMASADYIS